MLGNLLNMLGTPNFVRNQLLQRNTQQQIPNFTEAQGNPYEAWQEFNKQFTALPEKQRHEMEKYAYYNNSLPEILYGKMSPELFKDGGPLQFARNAFATEVKNRLEAQRSKSMPTAMQRSITSLESAKEYIRQLRNHIQNSKSLQNLPGGLGSAFKFLEYQSKSLSGNSEGQKAVKDITTMKNILSSLEAAVKNVEGLPNIKLSIQEIKKTFEHPLLGAQLTPEMYVEMLNDLEQKVISGAEESINRTRPAISEYRFGDIQQQGLPQQQQLQQFQGGQQGYLQQPQKLPQAGQQQPSIDYQHLQSPSGWSNDDKLEEKITELLQTNPQLFKQLEQEINKMYSKN